MNAKGREGEPRMDKDEHGWGEKRRRAAALQNRGGPPRPQGRPELQGGLLIF